ncbi:MAG TPA: glycosyltransferase family 4 protein [Gemmatimonadales bacterium]|jgi:UDP-glucose:(heptosyl)LPS alpha-1,3-glucosyltransferase|nr:glycosyltransferase family 4 protein [Gemmatimonadales bacterium]
MRIGFFVPSCTPENSHGRYVIELGKRLAAQHDVVIHAGAFWPPLRSLVQCRALPIVNRPAAVRLATLWMAAGIVAKSRLDVVHVQGADAPIGDVVTAHCCNAAMRRAEHHDVTWVRRLNYALGVAAERHCLTRRGTRRVIAVSDRVKGEIERYYGVDGATVTVIPPGVDAQAFHPRNRATLRQATRERLGLAPDAFVVAFVGRDDRRKGLGTLVDAVHVAGPGVQALAVGPRARTHLRTTSGDQVTFVRATPDIVPYYAAADCFALPTRYDTFSLATLEAMASGLPTIVSRAAGVSDYLTDGVDALILEDAGDVTTLAAHLRRLASDQALRARVARGGRETAERFSWERTVARTVDVYRQALDSRA